MALEETVTRLIAAARACADCYRVGSQNLPHEPAIAHFFDEQAEYHDLAAEWLEETLMDSGKRPVAEILSAPPPEGWTRPALGDTNPKTVIEACHASEEVTINEFANAEQDLPAPWAEQVRNYVNNMRSAIAKLHAWMEGKEIGPQPD
jgi:hypothetical protein